jgi:hypothetical protein
MAHTPTASYPNCLLCSERIELESANYNENGKAVHEECYVAHTVAQKRAEPPMRDPGKRPCQGTASARWHLLGFRP